jgi:transcriptional regulator with XRE-family HTH domain
LYRRREVKKMGRDAMKACENPCFRCRKEAAKYNDKLNSREGAAEMLGVSVSSLADYELGITKVIPVDKVVLMAELYNAPELKAWYCAEECPIGRGFPMPSAEITSVERTTMQLLKQLREADVRDVKDTLIDITADGVISDDERPELEKILEYLDGLIKAAGELRLIGKKVLNGDRQSE